MLSRAEIVVFILVQDVPPENEILILIKLCT